MQTRKTLADLRSRQAISARIGGLTPQAPRKWGKMSAHQMLRHLADSYRGVIGERTISAVRLWIPRPLLKWLILNAPWPKSAPTRPEVDPFAAGTPATGFESDRLELLGVIERFCSAADSVRTPHPLLGELNRDEWLRWGYLHADHHLRQFGA